MPSKDGEAWNAFELDPQVVRIGSDPTLLRSLSAPDLRIVLGDARLTLAALPERYDLIVVDAFTSDAIPVHLLTRETFAGYLSLLTARGAIVLHISKPAHGAVAADGRGRRCRRPRCLRQRSATPDKTDDELRSPAEVVVFARDVRDLGDLPAQPGWKRLDPD